MENGEYYGLCGGNIVIDFGAAAVRVNSPPPISRPNSAALRSPRLLCYSAGSAAAIGAAGAAPNAIAGERVATSSAVTM